MTNFEIVHKKCFANFAYQFHAKLKQVSPGATSIIIKPLQMRKLQDLRFSMILLKMNP